MDRGSSKHGAKRDDELKKEVQGLTRSGKPTRAQEWREAEPPAAEEETGRPGPPRTRAGPAGERPLPGHRAPGPEARRASRETLKPRKPREAQP
ncbi:hypothetical protein ACFQ2B_30940 [Streptomyces stramineus]